jgi:hypothetical protein
MISKKEFTEKVEKLLLNKNVDVMSAILKICEEHLLEPESAKRLLSQPLKEKLEAEATSLNMINRNSKHSRASLSSFYSEK